MALLESQFQKGPGVDGLFPTHTPVEFGGDGEKPRSMAAEMASKFFKKITRRVKPIMKVRDAMDKVYSKGYFENHYPEADKELKKTLHTEAKVAHSRLLAKGDEDEQDEEVEHKMPNINININLGKLLG